MKLLASYIVFLMMGGVLVAGPKPIQPGSGKPVALGKKTEIPPTTPITKDDMYNKECDTPGALTIQVTRNWVRFGDCVSEECTTDAAGNPAVETSLTKFITNAQLVVSVYICRGRSFPPNNVLKWRPLFDDALHYEVTGKCQKQKKQTCSACPKLTAQPRKPVFDQDLDKRMPTWLVELVRKQWNDRGHALTEGEQSQARSVSKARRAMGDTSGLGDEVGGTTSAPAGLAGISGPVTLIAGDSGSSGQVCDEPPGSTETPSPSATGSSGPIPTSTPSPKASGR